MKQKEANWIKLSEKKASVALLRLLPPPPRSRKGRKVKTEWETRMKLHHKICYGEEFFFPLLFHLVHVIITLVTVVKTWIVMVMMVMMMILGGGSKIFAGN
jgi:hypothetical protein